MFAFGIVDLFRPMLLLLVFNVLLLSSFLMLPWAGASGVFRGGGEPKRHRGQGAGIPARQGGKR